MPSARSPSWAETAAGERPPRRTIFARWAPVIVWAACISWFSSDAFSARSTHHYIDPLLRLVFGDLSPQDIRFWHAVVRKAAHVTEYAVLAVLVCRALTEPGVPVRVGSVARTIAFCALYAALDELHQTFVVSRAGSPVDVAIDVAGATAGTLLLVLARGIDRAPLTPPPPAVSDRSPARA